MITRLFFLMLLCFGLARVTIAQSTSAIDSINTVYIRPSIYNVVTTLGIPNEEVLVNHLAKVSYGKRFDHRVHNIKPLQYEHIPAPYLLEKTLMVEGDYDLVIENYKKEKSEYLENADSILLPALADAARGAIAAFWGRDEMGNFDVKTALSAAEYAQSDLDAITRQFSVDPYKVLTSLTMNLLNHSYLFVYEIPRIQTYRQYYDSVKVVNARRASLLQVDSTSAAEVNSDSESNGILSSFKKKDTETTLTKDRIGVRGNYVAFVIKINWTKAVDDYFNTQLWVDKSIIDTIERKKRISLFDNYIFPLEIVHSVSGSFDKYITPEDSTEEETKNGLIDAINAYKEVLGGSTRKPTIDEIEQIKMISAANSIAGALISSAIESVPDFKLIAPLSATRPVQAKLGSKEGLYMDQRFYAYEIVMDRKTGQIDRKRRAVVRVELIGENDEIASGSSEPSVFEQQGGKRITPGLYLQEKKELGLALQAGYGMFDGEAGGINARLDLSLLEIVKFKRSSRLSSSLRGVSVGGSFSANFFINKNFFEDSLTQLFYFGGLSNGSAFTYGGTISKAYYYGRRGRLVVRPEVGYGVTRVNVSSKLFGNDSELESINGKRNYLSLAAGLGFNLTPQLTIFATPTALVKLEDSYDWQRNGDEGSISATVDNSSLSSDWGFENINKPSLPIVFSLHLRL